MLTGSNNRALEFKKVNPELRFFYQRWQELLEVRTLDMYQYNILNSCSACLELQDVVDQTLTGMLLSRQNVDDIKAEALEIMKSDDVLIKYNKPLWITLMRILSAKIGKKRPDNSTDEMEKDNFHISLFRLKHLLASPCRSLKENFKKYVIQELKEDIGRQNKNLIEKHMSVLISQCINEGWSAKGLFYLSTLLQGAENLEDKINLFLTTILSTDTNNFEIYYSIKIETRPGLGPDAVRETIKNLGIDLKKGNDIIDADVNRQSLYNLLDSEKHYAIVSLIAHDIHSAVLSAINILHSKLSIATFYNTISPSIASFPSIVAFNNTKNIAKSLKMSDVFKTYDYVDSSNNVFEDTKNIINDPNKHHIITKLDAAFSYTNLSRSSHFQETKFITLWIALESIMKTGQYPDIITHVKKILPSALCVRYFYKLVRNFAEDCIRCNIKNLNQPIDLNLQNYNKKQIVVDLISIFRDSTKYSLLLQKCELNDLLHYRCEQIHEIFNNADKIQEVLKHHKTKVEWHIQRLYRIRNEITHSAIQNERSLVIYIEHLYSYLSQLISEIVFYIQHKNTKSIEEVYAVLENNYLTFMEIMDLKTMNIQDILSNGIIDVI